MKIRSQTLRDHIALSSDLYVSHDDLRSKVFECQYIELRATSDGPRTAAQGGAAPMEKGAFGQGWKSKGVWKEQKYKFRKSGDGTTKENKGKKGKPKGK